MTEEQKNKPLEKEEKTENNLLPTTQGKRFLNYVLDFIFLYIFAIAFGFVMVFIGLFSLIENTHEYLLGIIIAIIFYVMFETIWSKTPAKFITKTKVITENGEKPEFGTILGRTLIRFIPFEPFSFLTSGRPKGWHDRWSKTMVIDDKITQKENTYSSETKVKENGDEKSVGESKKISYCSQCGNKIDRDAIYCPKCGSRIY